MSAGFDIAGEVFWGTNGAVETYIDALASEAAARHGHNDPLVAFLSDERDGFFPGKVMALDAWLTTAPERERLVALLDAATERLVREGTLTEQGQSWVASVIAALRARVASGGTPDTVPEPDQKASPRR